MNGTTKATLAFVAAAATSFGILHASDAHAVSWIRHHPTVCALSSFTSTDTVSYNGGQILAAAAGNQTHACQIEDNAEHQHHLMTDLTVHVQDNHAGASISASACVTFHNALGGTCGTADTSIAGWDVLFPSRTVLAAQVNHFSYLSVSIPPSTGTPSRFAGYVSYYP